jgi:peptide-methionine (S)-S-oxide reductase
MPARPPRNVAITAAFAAAILAGAPLPAAEQGDPMATPAASETEKATFGGGCFWCIEAVFQTVKGVKSAVSGYAGGHAPNPTYKQVCAGDTGHAEVVQIEFDPKVITYEQLLDLFWTAHDPTSLNRQGADKGTQYRSIVLYHNDAQRQAAEKSKAKASAGSAKPFVTEIQPLEKFYPAEDYHQDYFDKNPNAAYCTVVIRPKVEKFKSH